MTLSLKYSIRYNEIVARVQRLKSGNLGMKWRNAPAFQGPAFRLSKYRKVRSSTFER